MPQQINLRTPILLTQRHYFSASTMAWALGVIGLFSAALCAYWMWSLELNRGELTRTLNSYAEEKERLQAALKTRQASALPADAGLLQELRARQAQLERQEQLLAELGRGLLRDGRGHAARLRLVAQTIPAEVWVTEMRADEQQMEAHGYTLDPAALNQWVARLGAHPLLQGHALSAIKVERVSGDVPGARPRWAFALVSTASDLPAIQPGGRP